MQRFSICLVLSVALISAVLVTPAVAQRLPTNHTEDLWSTGSQPLTVTVDVPARGWLAVEVTTPGGEAAQSALHPWLELSAPARTVHRQPDRHLFEVPAAGTYQFHVGSVRGGGPYRWSSVLLPATDLYKEGGDGDGTEEPDNQVLPLLTRWTDLCGIGTGTPRVPEKEGGDGDGTEEPDNQVLPVTVQRADLCRIDWAVRSAKSAVPEKEGGDGDGTEEPDNQVLPLLFGGFDCAAGMEPANNLSLCARPIQLGAAVSASLVQGFGVDQDYFVFDLRRATRVEVASTGGADTFGTLFDAFGHPLMADDDSGKDGNFTLAATLGPGRYFVRVEGAVPTTGDYGLQVRRMDP